MLVQLQDILQQHKAEDILTYHNVHYEEETYLVGSCLSNKHTKAVAQYLVQELKHSYDEGYFVEGLQEGNWVLIGVDNIMVHIFQSSVRQYYNVDQLWSRL